MQYTVSNPVWVLSLLTLTISSPYPTDPAAKHCSISPISNVTGQPPSSTPTRVHKAMAVIGCETSLLKNDRAESVVPDTIFRRFKKKIKTAEVSFSVEFQLRILHLLNWFYLVCSLQTSKTGEICSIRPGSAGSHTKILTRHERTSNFMKMPESLLLTG